MLAFLLHGAVTAAPIAEHGAHTVLSGALEIQIYNASQAELSKCSQGIANGSCCDTVCSATLLPFGYQVLAVFCEGDGTETAQIKPGIDPGGPRRPPKATPVEGS